LSASQLPERVGRLIAVLAVDPQLMSVTGQSRDVAELARRHRINVTD